MSVQTVSRIATLLAVDTHLLEKFCTEEGRSRIAYLYRSDLVAFEKDLLTKGDFQKIFDYILEHLPKPVNGEEPGG